jgi:hypothetical protein rflaF_11145
MIITKIVFLLMIIICVMFYILYLWDFALVLLVVTAALPLVMFIAALILKHNIKAEIIITEQSVSKNHAFPVQLCLTNKSFIPIGKAEARIDYYNIFSNQITTFYLDMPVQARNTQKITFQLSSKFCGIVNIRTEYINIYDPIRMFRFKTAKKVGSSISIMPEIYEIDGTVSFTDRINEESNAFSETKPGDDPSEIFDLREYNAGDRLNRIHWKLSSKKDNFIVKEYSLPVDVPSMIFINLKCYEDSDYTLPVFDTLIETLFAVSQFFIENERVHRIVFYNSKSREFTEKIIASSDDIADAARELVCSFNDDLNCLEPDVYFSDSNNFSLSSFTYITSSENDPAISYIDDKIDSDIKNAAIIVKSSSEASNISAGGLDINIIPVVIGRISSSIKDIEL